MKNGNIFIDKEGTDISKIEVKKRNQVLHDYYVMREDARKNKDKFFMSMHRSGRISFVIYGLLILIIHIGKA